MWHFLGSCQGCLSGQTRIFKGGTHPEKTIGKQRRQATVLTRSGARDHDVRCMSNALSLVPIWFPSPTDEMLQSLGILRLKDKKWRENSWIIGLPLITENGDRTYAKWTPALKVPYRDSEQQITKSHFPLYAQCASTCKPTYSMFHKRQYNGYYKHLRTMQELRRRGKGK